MKRKFNWIDIAIICILVAIFYVGYSFVLKPSGTSVEKVPVEITYRVEGVLMESVNGIEIGDIFKDKDTNQVIGEVVAKEVTDAYELVETGDGRIVKSRRPNRYDVYITIRGDAIITDDYIRMGGRDMRIEGTVFLKSTLSSVKSIITDINILE